MSQGVEQTWDFGQPSRSCPAAHLHGEGNEQHHVTDHRRIEGVVAQPTKNMFAE